MGASSMEEQIMEYVNLNNKIYFVPRDCEYRSSLENNIACKYNPNKIKFACINIAHKEVKGIC